MSIDQKMVKADYLPLLKMKKSKINLDGDLFTIKMGSNDIIPKIAYTVLKTLKREFVGALEYSFNQNAIEKSNDMIAE